MNSYASVQSVPTRDTFSKIVEPLRRGGDLAAHPLSVCLGRATSILAAVHEAMPKTGERAQARKVRDKLLMTWARYH